VAQDPKHAGPTPPQPEQQQEPPGHTAEMTPKPDHGEESYKGCGKLEGRVAIITGGDSGIGRAVAIAFAREGADVLISYLPEEEDDARETARWVEQAGRRVVLVSGDIADQQHCKGIVERAVSEFGKLDILVNNAAFQRTYEEIEDITAEEWDRPSPQLLAYAATKGAISNFTAALAQMLADRGIRVNAVAPGPIWTPLIPSTVPADKAASFGQQVPLSRAGQPKELAPAFVLLASDEASYISGAVVPVTGGKPML
jgi:NAD(P)-dependent dehydrogenase (short-subunit alcohol dehydrogenase family)